MVNTKTEKPETATSAAAKQRKPRAKKSLTPLESAVLASLNEQKAAARALRGIAKAVSQLTHVQALHVLKTVVESLENQPTVPNAESTGN